MIDSFNLKMENLITNLKNKWMITLKEQLQNQAFRDEIISQLQYSEALQEKNEIFFIPFFFVKIYIELIKENSYEERKYEEKITLNDDQREDFKNSMKKIDGITIEEKKSDNPNEEKANKLYDNYVKLISDDVQCQIIEDEVKKTIEEKTQNELMSQTEYLMKSFFENKEDRLKIINTLQSVVASQNSIACQMTPVVYLNFAVAYKI